MLNIILIFIGLMAFAQSATGEPSKVKLYLMQSLNELIQRTKDTHEELKKQTALLEGFNKLCKLTECKPSECKNENNSNSPPQNTQVGPSQTPDMQSTLELILNSIAIMNSKKNCVEATSTIKTNIVHNIRIGIMSTTVISVSCNSDWQGGGWLVFQRRKDGSVDFNRNWEDYKNGFGNVRGEFFLGLEKLHAITNETPQELLIVLTYRNTLYFAKYDEFAIGDESQSYAMNVLGTYSGNATDSLSYHQYKNFSTKDRDNTVFQNSCAAKYQSGWWFHSCYYSNLNGVYEGIYFNGHKSGVDWNTLKCKLRCNFTLTFSEMMVRPKRIKLFD